LINYIWFFLIFVGIIYAMINGNIEHVNKAIFEGAKNGVTISLSLISLLSFWLGLMKIAETSGFLKLVTKILSPFICLLFPSVPKNSPALGYIISNISANLFGLGNAATPVGIKAMQELQKLNYNKDEPSSAMQTLLALNTSGLTLIPTTVIAIRMQYNSMNPTEIITTTLIATIIATSAAIFFDYFYRQKYNNMKVK